MARWPGILANGEGGGGEESRGGFFADPPWKVEIIQYPISLLAYRCTPMQVPLFCPCFSLRGGAPPFAHHHLRDSSYESSPSGKSSPKGLPPGLPPLSSQSNCTTPSLNFCASVLVSGCPSNTQITLIKLILSSSPGKFILCHHHASPTRTIFWGCQKFLLLGQWSHDNVVAPPGCWPQHFQRYAMRPNCSAVAVILMHPIGSCAP